MDINYISLTKKEEMLLKLIGRVGFYFEAYSKELGVYDSTIRSCLKKGLIKKDKPVFIFTKLLSPYRLSPSGKEVVKYYLLIPPYRDDNRHIEHDYILGKVYLSLSEIEKESWKTETELLLNYPKLPVVDGVFTDLENNVVGVEIITNNYSQNNINNKMNFINKYCDKAIVINNKDLF